jgi:hypothetical protein
VKCGHCGSNLLVTGRKQLLSYYIEPRLDKHRLLVAAAPSLTDQDGKTAKISTPRLYFVPYYRLTGHEFRWEKESRKSTEEENDDPSLSIQFSQSVRRITFSHGADLIGGLVKILNKDDSGSSKKMKDLAMFMLAGKGDQQSPAAMKGGGQKKLIDRYFDKNFIACDFSFAGLYSLGVRPVVLTLKLFSREQLSKSGTMIEPEISPEDALVRGMEADHSALLSRALIDRVLSIIYFPFWCIEFNKSSAGKAIIVDAVAGSVITADADAALIQVLDKQRQATDQYVAGFRSLVCPNCAGDFPVRPYDVIFFCSQCGKAWQIYGDSLSEVNHEVADSEVPREQDVRYLPFWILNSVNGGSPFRYYLPSFRYKRLKFIHDVAMNITQMQPAYKVTDGHMPELASGSFEGCCYDQEDAALFARFINAGLKLGSAETVKEGEDLTFTNATLTWFPFKVNGNWLTDPFTGFNLPLGLFM